MRRWLTLCLVGAALTVAGPATPQDDDPGLVGGLIEDALSGPGREVRVTGFSGALSGQARLDRITISDSEGAWLILEDAELDWNRGALLRRRLDIQTLNAARVEVLRRPLPAARAPAPPSAEASGFALPELPVSIRVAELRVDEVSLGTTVLGEPATFRIEGEAGLADGAGGGRLTALRTDAANDRIGLSASFSNITRIADITLGVTEAPGGLLGRLLDLPGQPSLALSLSGNGPLDDFDAELTLASNGVERLAGQTRLRGDGTGTTRFEANIGGDLTPLLAPDMREFLGDDLAISLAGARTAGGATEIAQFDVSGRSLDVSGTARIGTAGLPEAFVLSGRLADPSGDRLQLPGASGAEVDTADLTARFDASASDAWTLGLTLAAPSFETWTADAVALNGGGRIIADADARSITARLDYAAEGLNHADDAVGLALGARVGGTADIAWVEGQPLTLSQLTLGGTDYGLQGTGTFDLVDRSLAVTGEATAFARDLARFSSLAGQPLTGDVTVALTGQGDVLGGIFDAALRVAGDGVSIGNAAADRMLAGPIRFDTALARDMSGTELQRFELSSTGLIAEGSGIIGPVGGALSLSATLTDLSLLNPRYEGALTISGRVSEPREEAYALDVVLDGPYALGGTVVGEVGPEAQGTVALNLSLPEIAPLVPGHSGALRITGTAAEQPGNLWDVDLAIAAPYGAGVLLNGSVGAGASDLQLSADLPDIAPLVPTLSGPIEVRGTATELNGAQWRVDLSVDGPLNSQVNTAGTLGSGRGALRFTGTLPDIAPLAASYTGALDVRGRALQTDGEPWSVTLAADAPYDGTLSASARLVPGAIETDLRAELPDLAAIVPALPGPLTLSGSLRQASAGGWALDAETQGPKDTVLTAAGTFAAPTGSALTGRLTVPELSAFVPSISGASVIDLTARQAPNTPWRVGAEALGPYNARTTLAADLTQGAVTAALNANLPDIAPLAPGLRGGVALAVTAEQAEDAWQIAADATGPYRSTVSASGRYAPGRSRATLSAGLPDIGPVAPGLAGALQIDAIATEITGAFDIEATVAGPYRSTARIDARIAPETASGSGDLTLTIPNISPLAPGLSGAVTMSGTARQDPSGWGLGLLAEGPGSARTQVSGSAAPTFARVDLGITGSAPLALANQILAPRQIEGQIRYDLALSGAPQFSALSGRLATEGARLALPTLGQTLDDITATATLAGGTAQLNARASGPQGGSLSLSGPITLTGARRADVTLALQGFVIEDPDLFRTRLDGAARFSGPLNGGGQIDGRVTIGRSEIQIPSGGLGFGGSIPRMLHINEPAAVRLTRLRAGAVETQQTGNTGVGSAGPAIALDLIIDAPREVFVRGRGLDVELGGRVRLTGTSRQPSPIGAIGVIRGSLALAGKRLTIDRDGTISLAGGFTPILNLSASTEADDVLLIIRITGPVDDPIFSFESEPELPPDEVLSRLLFGQDIQELSAFQAAQLAASIAELSGRGAGGLLGSVRSDLGLDQLDISTGDDGAAEVTAGRYLNDNIYTDVTTRADGTSRLRLNIDLTDTISITGAADSDGDTSIGIFFERDY